MIRTRTFAAAVLGALVVTAYAATPALATPAAVPTVTASAEVCAAVTVDGVTLLQQRDPALAQQVMSLAGVSEVTPANVAAARQGLGCGAAPAGSADGNLADAQLALCAALTVGNLTDLTAQLSAVVRTAVGLLDTDRVLTSARNSLGCGAAAPAPTTTPAPTTSPAPTTTAAPTAVLIGGGSTGATGGGSAVFPDSAPETGA